MAAAGDSAAAASLYFSLTVLFTDRWRHPLEYRVAARTRA